jgi:hypothetical protein
MCCLAKIACRPPGVALRAGGAQALQSKLLPQPVAVGDVNGLQPLELVWQVYRSAGCACAELQPSHSHGLGAGPTRILAGWGRKMNP